MKFRKWTALAAAIALLITLTGTALAATTVTGTVYGVEGVDPGTPAPAAKIAEVQTKLAKAGVTDVPAEHYAASSIVALIESGAMKPDETGKINPDAGVSSSQGVAVIAKILGIASMTDSNEEAAVKAKAGGLVGKDAALDQPMSRMEVARLIAKALGVFSVPLPDSVSDMLPFKDHGTLKGEDADTDRGILFKLYSMGIFKGFPDGTFRPDEILSTAQIAILVDRILGTVRPQPSEEAIPGSPGSPGSPADPI